MSMRSIKQQLFIPHVEGTASKRLDAVRGVAVLLVLFAHLDNYLLLVVFPFSYSPFQHFIGQLGVHLFFILSGYLIWQSAKFQLNRVGGIKRYAINRLTRLYPLYLISIIFIILASPYYIGYFHPKVEWMTVLRHLLFLQHFEPDVSNYLNGPFWTLTHEMLFYILVPFLFMMKMDSRKILISVLFAQLSLMLLGDYLHQFLNYWVLFAFGIFLSQYQLRAKLFYSLILCWLAFMLMIANPDVLNYQLLLAIGFFGVLQSFSFTQTVFVPLIYSGVISYSLYIWHTICIHLFSRYFYQDNFLIVDPNFILPQGFSLRGVVIIAIIFFVSVSSYYLIERPGMTSLRTYLKRRLAQGVNSGV